MAISKIGIKLKVKTKISKYNGGKDPNVDEPDEIVEGKEKFLEYDDNLKRWREKDKFSSSPEKIAKGRN